MSSFNEHCADCIEKLGKGFSEVHIWLDAHNAEYGPDHRVIRHHQAGVEKVRQMWGDQAAQAAEIHIMADCFGIPTLEEAYWTGYYKSAFGSRAIEQLEKEFPKAQ